MVWLRRFVQTVSLVLFFGLLLATRAENGTTPKGPLQLFFDLDPLILLSTWFSTHKIAGLSLLALVTVAVTILLGRVFCGWVCPFGVLHNVFTWLRSRLRKGAPRAEVYSPWQRAKYFLVIGLLVMAILGAQWVGVFDPMAMLYRSTVITVVPATQSAVEDASTTVYDSDPHVGPFQLTKLTEPVYRFFRDRVFGGQGSVFTGSTLVFLLFLSALLLNFYRPRFWCRYVCPLGGLLGLLARRGTLRLTQSSAECTDCGLCTIRCPAAAQPEKPGEWLADECFGCWNCVAACKPSGLDFKFEVPWRKPEASSVGLSRRTALRSMAAGIVGLLLFRITPQARAKTFNPTLIRPPGSRPEREFLQRCIQCGQCMKVCPSNALHPTLAEAGLEGIWTPVLVARIGYCEYECNLCCQVCPTEAIQPLELDVKKKAKIGMAVIEVSRCLPYAYDRECIVCEEHCPIPTKAIYFVQRQVEGRNGVMHTLKLPRVDVDLCTGCGICETKCPVTAEPAVRIISANEDRHPDNQPILPTAETLFQAYP
jgi:MauM/NapG family ferredoxin protein